MSVILTTFNRSELATRAIDSVLAQTLTDFELIVVDDCSTDGTADAVARIDDSRLSLIRHDTNLGLAEARNSGIRVANGSLVCFLDDDDEFMPNKLRVQSEAFEEEADSDNVVLHCQAVVDDGISSDVRPMRGLRPGEPLCEYLMCGEGAMPIHSIMVTRELVANTMFAPRQRTQEDYSWLLRLETQGARFVLVQQPLVVWRVDMKRPRLSRATSFERAGEWLDSCGPTVTPRARKAFLAREIAPSVERRGNRLRVLRTIVSASTSRAISPGEGFKSLLKAFLPPGVLYRLRHLLPRSRFG